MSALVVSSSSSHGRYSRSIGHSRPVIAQNEYVSVSPPSPSLPSLSPPSSSCASMLLTLARSFCMRRRYSAGSTVTTPTSLAERRCLPAALAARYSSDAASGSSKLRSERASERCVELRSLPPPSRSASASASTSSGLSNSESRGALPALAAPPPAGPRPSGALSAPRLVLTLVEACLSLAGTSSSAGRRTLERRRPLASCSAHASRADSRKSSRR